MFIYRLLEKYPPSVLMLELAAGIGTFTLGLKFTVPFMFGVMVLAVGLWLDNYRA